MPLCKLSSESMINSYTILDNMFLVDYMPNADENAVKVYLYGLMQCANMTGKDNSTEGISMALGITMGEVEDAIHYWADNGVIKILSEEPLSYEYLPLKTTIGKVKKYDPEKYSDFITQLESMILERAMTQNEIMKYIETMEEYKIKDDAMLMIVSYCIKLKGAKVHTNYILTVAKAWASEGITDLQSVEMKLREMEANTDNMRQVFYALGLKSTPDFDDKNQFIKWNSSWGYDLESILYVAKICKKRGGMKKLDSMLDEFYKKGIFTLSDIQNHAEYIEYVRNLTININKRLGIFYENIEPVIEQYVVPWLDKGYDGKGLLTIASFCFHRNIKHLDGVNETIDNLYRKGVISNQAIDDYFDTMQATDKTIKAILQAIGSSRSVSQSDRDYYSTWVEMWGFSKDIIDYAVSLSIGKSHSLAYVNQLLSTWKNNNLKTVLDCQNYSNNLPKIDNKNSKTQQIEGQRTYSKEELDKIYGNLEEESRFDF